LIVGYHAPPAGSKSGVADYAEALERVLSRLCEIQRDATTADVHLYHLGNNRLHETIYGRALAKPGVIVLHDALLHHLFLGTLTREQYLAEFVFNYGEWSRSRAEQLWEERARAAIDHRYFEAAMLRRAVESARSVIVHNPGAAAIARAHGAAEVDVIPHFYEPLAVPDAFETLRFRETLGVEPGVRLFGLFGYLREPKRVMPVIAAFRRVHAVHPDTALLLAGEPVSDDLRRLLDATIGKGGDGVLRRGHLDENSFRIALASVDCGINLRSPGAGETSGVTIRLMGMGTPVMVTDCPENSGYPLESVFRVRAGIAEGEELFDHIVLVTEFPEIARKVGREGRKHIAGHHALDLVARHYWEILCRAAA
jgi:glycosyltransferase involved in cell wall biosynthesis